MSREVGGAVPASSFVGVEHSNAVRQLLQILKRLPHLKKLDSIPVDVEERESAAKA